MEEGLQEVARFLGELGTLPRLRRKEQLKLAQRARTGGRRSRERRIRGNLPLVVSVVGRYRRDGASYANLLQDGIVGLLQAVDRFDPERGSRFSTYATRWIDQPARIAVRTAQTVRLSQQAFGNYVHIRRAQEQFRSDLGRPATLAELAAETLPDPAPPLGHAVAGRLQREAIRRVVASLPSQDRGLLHRHFRSWNGLDSGRRIPALLETLRNHRDIATAGP